AKRGITCRFGTSVSEIDRAARLVQTDDGESHTYDKLILATGSTPFIIPLPGHDLDGVIAYRDVEDTSRMMALGAGQRAVVIGGGLLGLEAAAGMAARGAHVTVVHLMDHLMERQLDPEAGAMLAKSLEAKGIELRLGAQSKEILGEDGRVTGLALEDGTVLPCDLLVMAVGIRPNLALAKDAGLHA
ncbi:MAG: FAD-dependent oxidoreductase, partial [Pseudomonadota bacterium]